MYQDEHANKVLLDGQELTKIIQQFADSIMHNKWIIKIKRNGDMNYHSLSKFGKRALLGYSKAEKQLDKLRSTMRTHEGVELLENIAKVSQEQEQILIKLRDSPGASVNELRALQTSELKFSIVVRRFMEQARQVIEHGK